MAALASLLPTPRYKPASEQQAAASSSSSSSAKPAASSSMALTTTSAPPYGHRSSFRPSTQADFGDGGAYPECPIAQYPLELGRKKAAAGNGKTLALQVDQDGNVDYAAIARQGQREGKNVQSSFKDLVPIKQRTDLSKKEKDMERPSEEEVMSTAERTRLALEKITNSRIQAAQPSRVPDSQGSTSYIRYTPSQQSTVSQRIIKMTEVVEDPLEPARFKAKKIPRGPPSPPPPQLRSPPRKATAQEQKEWMIPPCISNWKNNKGYTIPLDKRLAADGRGLQDVHINDNFAKFSEALFVADRHARDEVRQRALMQQKIAAKEKAAKEENLRLLAQRARDDRAGIPSAPLPGKAAETGLGGALGGYGSGSDDSSSDSDSAASDAEEDNEEVRERERMRREKKQEREREMRLNNMGNEKRAIMMAKEQNRDISEKVALGLAKPTASKETMIDSRLFNRETLAGSFGGDDSYNMYDKPLFHGSAAAAAIYKPLSSTAQAAGDETYGGGTEDGVVKNLQNDRFALGVSHAFEGTDGPAAAGERSGPVQFEKDTVATVDPFGLDEFLDQAKAGKKRGGLELSEKAKGKRTRTDGDD